MAPENNYEILEELGRGGMGVVYRARDLSLDREVALKVLPESLSQDSVLLERFQREAKAAAALNHPNIVTVFAIGMQDGAHHIAMELVEGSNLGELLEREGALPADRATGYVIQTADALKAAHSKGIVHRDVKPHNIMIDENDQVKVTDFGLARHLHAPEITAEGAQIGTPRYMSPEQISTENISYPTDVYSLGIVFFELLTGRPAFDAHTTVALMHKILHDPFPDIIEAVPGISPSLAAIIGRMAAKKLDDRYANFEKVLADLQAWRSGSLAPERMKTRFGMATERRSKPPRETVKAAARPSQPKIWRVPLDPDPKFTGRRSVMKHIHSLLHNEGGVATLLQVDPQYGGFGLSRLAAEYAYKYKSEYRTVWWIRAQLASVCDSDFSELALALGMDTTNTRKLETASSYVKDWLSTHSEWLLIFDCATRMETVSYLIPETQRGHVLITSHKPRWPRELNTLTVRGLQREDSMGLLSHGSSDPTGFNASELATELGDVPLALSLASAYMAATEEAVDRYTEGFSKRHGVLWGTQDPPTHSVAVIATVLSLTLERLAVEHPDALDLVKLCSYLHETDLRANRLALGARSLPRPLGKVVAKESRLAQACADLIRFGLGHMRSGALLLNAMTQDLVRKWMETDLNGTKDGPLKDFVSAIRPSRAERKDTDFWAASSLKWLNSVLPADPSKDDGWIEFAVELPHVITILKHADRLSLDRTVTGDIWRRMGVYFSTRREFNRATRAYERAAQFYQDARGKRRKVLSQILKDLAYAHGRLLDGAQARKAYEQALGIDQQVYGKNHKEVTAGYRHLGKILLNAGDHDGAQELFTRALETNTARLGAKHPELCRDFENLGSVCQEKGDHAAAREHYSQALKIAEDSHGKTHEMVSSALRNLGGVHQQMSDLINAEEFYERALAIDSSLHTSPHTDVADDYTSLGAINESLGLLAEAEANYQNALKIDEGVHGRSHPKVAIHFNNVGKMKRQQGDLSGAEGCCAEAVRIFAETLGKNHVHTRTAQRNLDRVRQQLRQDKSGPKVLD